MVWLIVPIYLASELWARDRRREETRAIDGETEAPASGTATRGQVIWPGASERDGRCLKAK